METMHILKIAPITIVKTVTLIRQSTQIITKIISRRTFPTLSITLSRVILMTLKLEAIAIMEMVIIRIRNITTQRKSIITTTKPILLQTWNLKLQNR